jgi:hypothetical protein
MIAWKLIPHLLSWAAILLVMLRGFPERRPAVMKACMAGFAVGVVGTFVLFRSFPGTLPFASIKSALGVSFFLLWAYSVTAIYRSTGPSAPNFRGAWFGNTLLCAAVCAGVSSVVAGGVTVCRIPGGDGTPLAFVLIALAAGALAYGAWVTERALPPSFTVSSSGMVTAVVSLLLFSSSSILRLDLFSPLSMKVMKGIHDFVHQFMESILIPDHLFVRSVVWKYIGILFGKGVGFWGGMVIWFTPAFLISLAINFERLPSVAHIRQGAQRRKLLAEAIKAQRFRLAAPLFSVVVFAAAAYQSSFPSTEYWDPKPIPVSANQAGEIIVPKKGEVNLEDGKLHKYLFKQGGREARFFIMVTPAGELTVDLDACAICKPDGYGQAEGSVICYYCKTLIPLETVGKPGGCNPVPVPFAEKGDSVVVDGITLINSWGATVQATARVKEGGK